MKVSVNGKAEDINLVIGVADNKPTNWTYEIVESYFTGSRDEDGNMVVKEEDFKLLKKIEEELKKNNEFSFELPKNWSLKTLYKKIVEENKEKTAMVKNKLANVIGKEITKNAATVAELEELAKKYEQDLQSVGYKDMQVDPYFAYGQYGFYFNFTRADGKSGQKYTGLDTKNNTKLNLRNCYYDLLNRKNWYLRLNNKESKEK